MTQRIIMIKINMDTNSVEADKLKEKIVRTVSDFMDEFFMNDSITEDIDYACEWEVWAK